jgi:chromosome segregation ATPase
MRLLFLVATLLCWSAAHADTIEEQLAQCQRAQEEKCQTEQLKEVLASSQTEVRKKQQEWQDLQKEALTLQTRLDELAEQCKTVTVQLEKDLNDSQAVVQKNEQYWHNLQTETSHKHRSELEAQRAASELKCKESTVALQAESNQSGAREQEWKKQVQDLEQQVQVLTQQHIQDMERVAQQLKDSHEEEVNHVVRKLETTRDQHNDLDRELDGTKDTLLRVRQELLETQERVHVLEKEATYYWDLLEEYKLYVKENYNRVQHFLETNKQVQAVYQPTKAAVLSLSAQFLQKATPIWDMSVEEITKRIPPQVAEHHGLWEGHFCVLTRKLNSFCKLRDAPDRLVKASEWLERNCAQALLYSEVALLMFFLYFVMRWFWRALFGAPKKKVVPVKQEPVKSNQTSKKKKKTQ